MAANSVLAALRAVATACHAAVWSFSDEQADQGIAVADGLRALFLPPPAAAAPAVQPQFVRLLQLLPQEILSDILSQLDTRDLARLAATCRALWRDAHAPPPWPMPPLRPMGLVETELRRRATARGLHIGATLPEGALSWVPYLLKRFLRDAMRREAPLAVAANVSLFVDREGRLLTCGTENVQSANTHPSLLLGHDWGPDVNPDEPRCIGPPTPVPSMQGRRIVSVAAGGWHCLALSREGEVYSWGDGVYGSLGHADGSARAAPSRIESLSRIESIAAGPSAVSAAVDEVGRLFTWGQAVATRNTGEAVPTGLGYEFDHELNSQLTPKWVDTLSAVRVVGVALGRCFTLAVTDAGTVFSFGYSQHGALGHGSLEVEVLPRRIEALALAGRRFVAVAAGMFHALALTEEGDLYEGEIYVWGDRSAAGHGLGHHEAIPRQVAALAGERVRCVAAGHRSSCAVTEKGELFTWGSSEFGHLGHGSETAELTPKRVEGLRGVTVATAAICVSHTLVTDEDGEVWAFGFRMAVGLGDLNVPQGPVLQPAQLPALRVRVRKSPDALPFRWIR